METIDISDFEARKGEIARQLFAAAKDVGFFYIAGACIMCMRGMHVPSHIVTCATTSAHAACARPWHL